MASPAFREKLRRNRVTAEIAMLDKRPPWGITCYPEKEDQIDVMLADIIGPRNTPYSRGKFSLQIDIPEKYPMEPPHVKFTTPVYHPNIDKEGRICLNVLKMPPNGGWVPTVTLENLLVAIQTLLACPNPDDPLMIDIANEYKNDYKKFEENASKHVLDHAVLCKEYEIMIAQLKSSPLTAEEKEKRKKERLEWFRKHKGREYRAKMMIDKKTKEIAAKKKADLEASSSSKSSDGNGRVEVKKVPLLSLLVTNKKDIKHVFKTETKVDDKKEPKLEKKESKVEVDESKVEVDESNVTTKSEIESKDEE